MRQQPSYSRIASGIGARHPRAPLPHLPCATSPPTAPFPMEMVSHLLWSACQAPYPCQQHRHHEVSPALPRQEDPFPSHSHPASLPIPHPSPHPAQLQVYQGMLLGAVCCVGLVVHRGLQLPVGICGDEAAAAPLRVLAGRLLPAALALGFPGAVPPAQVLRGQRRAGPAGLCQALE